MVNMKKLTTVFVAREYMLTDDFGGIRVDEEAVFSSFEQARSFLSKIEDKRSAGTDFLLFRTEIVEYQIDSIEPHERSWTYNLRGELIEHIESSTKSTLSNYNYGANKGECTCNHQVGDIVYILPKIENKLSPSTKGTYGVIVEIASEQSKERELEYVIYYIAENGLLDHFHAVESAIVARKEPLSYELRFLDLYSNYLKKQHEMDMKVISEIINDEVFIKNIKKLDFRTESIINPYIP